MVVKRQSPPLQMNMRQLCVHKLATKAGKPGLWWDYVTQVGELCPMATNNYTLECSDRVRGRVGILQIEGVCLSWFMALCMPLCIALDMALTVSEQVMKVRNSKYVQSQVLQAS